MKLKQIVGISIIFYIFSVGTITVMGLWVVKPTQISGLNVSPVSSTPTASTNQGESETEDEKPAAPSAVAPTNTATPTATTPAKSTGTTTKTTTTAPSTGGGTTTTPTPAPTPTPTPTPAPAPSCGTAGATCTSAQVATHNSSGNCWVIYGGKYYIVTSYVNNHPGGSSAFNSTSCGHDITGYMNGSQTTGGVGKHGHSGSAYNILTSYSNGPVSG